MNSNESFNYQKMNSRKATKASHTADCTLTIYIVMRILKLIKNQMGLEAMLEYVDKYIEKNENRHPQFPKAFSLAMQNQKLESIYENTVNYKKSPTNNIE